MGNIASYFEKLFSNDYFGVVLFCVIAFLILMFIVVLFFGLNDTKEEVKKDEKTDDVEAEADAFLRIDDTVQLDFQKKDMVGFDSDDQAIELPEKKKED